MYLLFLYNNYSQTYPDTRVLVILTVVPRRLNGHELGPAFAESFDLLQVFTSKLNCSGGVT